MSPNPGRRDRAEPTARPTGAPERGRQPSGYRRAGRVGVILLAATLLGACGASATQSPATPSPTANPDESLMKDLDAVWSSPYDADAVAALYATDATFHDVIANETFEGLAEIQARVESLAAQDFKATTTSAPIRQDDFVIAFMKYGPGAATYPGFGVIELKDGKVLNEWVYPAP